MENNLLGVKIDYPFNKNDFDDLLNKALITNDSKFIFTVNPEFIVDADKDQLFKNILNKGYFNSADGIGVVMALEYKHEFLRTGNRLNSLLFTLSKHIRGKLFSKRLTGVEITERILEYSNKNFLSIFLLGGDSRKMVSEKLLVDLEKKYPHVRFIGASSSFSSRPNDDESTISFIKSCMKKEGIERLDFLLVGYGHPFQEKWIDRNYRKLDISIYVGVGGTFDFLSGNVKRAPKFFQKLGLEWLFRLLMQPGRFHRIFKATFRFSYLIFTKIKR